MVRVSAQLKADGRMRWHCVDIFSTYYYSVGADMSYMFVCVS